MLSLITPQLPASALSTTFWTMSRVVWSCFFCFCRSSWMASRKPLDLVTVAHWITSWWHMLFGEMQGHRLLNDVFQLRWHGCQIKNESQMQRKYILQAAIQKKGVVPTTCCVANAAYDPYRAYMCICTVRFVFCRLHLFIHIYFDDCGTGKTINKHVNDGCANEKILHIYYIDPPICVITFLFKIISWKKDWDETWPLSLISQTFMAEATTTIAASHASRPRPKSWSWGFQAPGKPRRVL